MGFFRVSEPNVGAVTIADLGITIAQNTSNKDLSDQFSIEEIYRSKDLETILQAGQLTVQIDYGSGFQTVAPANYSSKDALAAFLTVYEIANQADNERLVDGSDASSGTALHSHDTRYFTKAQLQSNADGAAGATLVGIDQTPAFTNFTPASADVQAALTAIDNAFVTAVTLDKAYMNDSDGILLVNGTTKPLNFRSNNVNDIIMSRISGADIQDAIRMSITGNELLLGSLVQGALAQMNVRVRSNLQVDGNITYTGTIQDQTVDNMNVINANIRLRDGATGVAATDAYIEVERGTSGNDTRLLWNESSQRWQCGIVGAIKTIAWKDFNEVVTGIWELQGGGTTDPSVYLTNRAAAPTTNLGTSGQIPMTMINNKLAIYDKTNSRNAWLSVYRQTMYFMGRDSATNTNEYARQGGAFTSNQSSARLISNMKLIGITIQTNGNATWTARVRKNGVATNLASLVATAAAGAQDDTLNVDFNQGDKIDVFIEGSNVNRPVITLVFAERF